MSDHSGGTNPSRERKLPVVQLDNLRPVLRPDQLQEPVINNGVNDTSSIYNALLFQLDQSDPILNQGGDSSAAAPAPSSNTLVPSTNAPAPQRYHGAPATNTYQDQGSSNPQNYYQSTGHHFERQALYAPTNNSYHHYSFFGSKRQFGESYYSNQLQMPAYGYQNPQQTGHSMPNWTGNYHINQQHQPTQPNLPPQTLDRSHFYNNMQSPQNAQVAPNASALHPPDNTPQPPSPATYGQFISPISKPSTVNESTRASAASNSQAKAQPHKRATADDAMEISSDEEADTGTSLDTQVRPDSKEASENVGQGAPDIQSAGVGAKSTAQEDSPGSHLNSGKPRESSQETPPSPIQTSAEGKGTARTVLASGSISELEIVGGGGTALGATQPKEGAIIGGHRQAPILASHSGEEKEQVLPSLVDEGPEFDRLETQFMQNLEDDIVAQEEREFMARLDLDIRKAEQAENLKPIQPLSGVQVEATWLVPKTCHGWSVDTFSAQDFNRWKNSLGDKFKRQSGSTVDKPFSATVQTRDCDVGTWKVIAKGSRERVQDFKQKWNYWLKCRVRGCNYLKIENEGKLLKFELDSQAKLSATIEVANYTLDGDERHSLLLVPRKSGQLGSALQLHGLDTNNGRLVMAVISLDAEICRTIARFKSIAALAKKENRKLSLVVKLLCHDIHHRKKLQVGTDEPDDSVGQHSDGGVTQNSKGNLPRNAAKNTTSAVPGDLRLMRCYESFRERFATVIKKEFVDSGSGIPHSFASGSMWRQHKQSQFAGICSENCDCVLDLHWLAKDVVTDFRQKSRGWTNPLRLREGSFPIGLCGNFASMHLLSLHNEYPTKGASQLLDLLALMWTEHTKLFGKSCNAGCRCSHQFHALIPQATRSQVSPKASKSLPGSFMTTDSVNGSKRAPGELLSQKQKRGRHAFDSRVTPSEDRGVGIGSVGSGKGAVVTRKKKLGNRSTRAWFAGRISTTRHFSASDPAKEFVLLVTIPPEKDQRIPFQDGHKSSLNLEEMFSRGKFYEVMSALENGALEDKKSFDSLESLQRIVRPSSTGTRDSALKDKLLKIFIHAAHIFRATMALNDWAGFEVSVDTIEHLPSDHFPPFDQVHTELVGNFTGDGGAHSTSSRKQLAKSSSALLAGTDITFCLPAAGKIHFNAHTAKDRSLIVNVVGTSGFAPSKTLATCEIRLSDLSKKCHRDGSWVSETCPLVGNSIASNLQLRFRARRVKDDSQYHETKRKKEATNIKTVFDWVKRFNDNLSEEEKLFGMLSCNVPVFGRATLLHCAIRIREEPLVKMLLEYGADPLFHSRLGSPLLFAANLLDSATDGVGTVHNLIHESDHEFHEPPVKQFDSLDRRQANLQRISKALIRARLI